MINDFLSIMAINTYKLLQLNDTIYTFIFFYSSVFVNILRNINKFRVME